MTLRPVVFAIAVADMLGIEASIAAGQTDAWILWEKNYTAKGTTTTTTWEPQDGFEQLADCRKSAQQLLQIALTYFKNTGSRLLGPVQLDGRAATFAVMESGAQQTIDIRYLCFPGPFDPRVRP